MGTTTSVVGIKLKKYVVYRSLLMPFCVLQARGKWYAREGHQRGPHAIRPRYRLPSEASRSEYLFHKCNPFLPCKLGQLICCGTAFHPCPNNNHIKYFVSHLPLLMKFMM